MAAESSGDGRERKAHDQGVEPRGSSSITLEGRLALDPRPVAVTLTTHGQDMASEFLAEGCPTAPGQRQPEHCAPIRSDQPPDRTLRSA